MNPHLLRLLIVLSLCLIFSGFETFGATIHVSPNGDNSDPSSWDGAFSSIASAISAATAGDEIWVSSGRYNETFAMKDDLALLGGFPGQDATEEMNHRDFVRHESIVDATGFNDRAIVGADRCILDGFTITNGTRVRSTTEPGGSGILCEGVTMTIRNCTFLRNGLLFLLGGPEPAGGGGMFVINSDLDLSNCAFIRNSAHTGGAIFSTLGSNLTITNCFFHENSGAAVLLLGDETIIQSCTFGENGPNLNGRDVAGSGTTRVRNSIVRGGRFGPLSDVKYCNIVDEVDASPNINADPLFVDRENGDFRLLPNSPCIDSGTDVGIAFDLDGNPRPIDVVGRGHEGSGAYDMGCYEFVLKREDLNADGYVNTLDLILFQREWHESVNE